MEILFSPVFWQMEGQTVHNDPSDICYAVYRNFYLSLWEAVRRARRLTAMEINVKDPAYLQFMGWAKKLTPEEITASQSIGHNPTLHEAAVVLAAENFGTYAKKIKGPLKVLINRLSQVVKEIWGECATPKDDKIKSLYEITVRLAQSPAMHLATAACVLAQSYSTEARAALATPNYDGQDGGSAVAILVQRDLAKFQLREVALGTSRDVWYMQSLTARQSPSYIGTHKAGKEPGAPCSTKLVYRPDILNGLIPKDKLEMVSFAWPFSSFFKKECEGVGSTNCRAAWNSLSDCSKAWLVKWSMNVDGRTLVENKALLSWKDDAAAVSGTGQLARSDTAKGASKYDYAGDATAEDDDGDSAVDPNSGADEDYLPADDEDESAGDADNGNEEEAAKKNKGHG